MIRYIYIYRERIERQKREREREKERTNTGIFSLGKGSLPRPTCTSRAYCGPTRPFGGRLDLLGAPRLPWRGSSGTFEILLVNLEDMAST